MPRPTIYYNDNDPQVCEWIRQLMFDAVLTQPSINGNSNAKESDR